MAKIVSLLNGGVAEVGDESAKSLIASGNWAAVAAPRKARAVRTKAPEEPKPEE